MTTEGIEALVNMPIRELWDLNTLHKNRGDRYGVKDTAAELMFRTDTSLEARKESNRQQAEYRAKQAQKEKEAGK